MTARDAVARGPQQRREGGTSGPGGAALRVAVIAPPYLPVPPVRYGGTEQVLDVLCRGLVAAGHDVLLCTTGDSTCPVPRRWSTRTAVGVEAAHPVVELRHVIDAYRAAVDWRADIVHDHTFVGLAWAARYPRLPVVATAHLPFAGDLSVIYAAVARRIPVVAVSHDQASAATFPIAAVIHHGVDVRQHVEGTGAGGYAAFLGRMSADKGLHTAIEVARQAGVPLRIAAAMRDAAEHEYFTEVIEPLLGDAVEYVGEVGGAAKHRLLAEARCLLNPVEWPEPFGMVMIEALAHGTPVVATPCGAVPEIVRDGVTGFVRSSAESLVEALSRVGELDRRACRSDVEARFSMERLAADHLALYRRALAGQGSPAALVAS